MSVTNTYIDTIPGEDFLAKALQSQVSFVLGKKTIKQGRLIIFKKVHYYIQITILNSKNTKETFEIPIPYATEYYPLEGLAYFDYRIKALAGNNIDLNNRLSTYRLKNVTPSQYYNKILEIQVS